jgi:hypothetical protein
LALDVCGAPGAGTDYRFVAQATGGSVHSLCDPDWQPILAALGTDAVGIRSAFYLSDMPVVDSIEVHIEDLDGYVLEGAPVDDPDRCDTTCFSFDDDPRQNRVTILDHVVPEGATVTIDYLVSSANER